MTLPLDLYISSTGYVAYLHSHMEIERGVTMTFPDSETVDRPRKREKKTQNANSHNTIKLEQSNQLESTITTPQNN